MPPPTDAKGKPSYYTDAFPSYLRDHLGEIALPPTWHRRGGPYGGKPERTSETPLLFDVPSSGGSLAEEILVRCHGLVGAVGHNTDDVPVGMRSEFRKEKLSIVDLGKDRGRYVNVDTVSDSGIDRASALRLVPSGLADFVSTPRLHRASSALFDVRHRARMFALLRHPVDRAVAEFHRIKSDPKSSADVRDKMTLEEYASSDLAEGNWVTRFLSGHGGESELTSEVHASLAKEVLRRKAVIGMWDKMESSMERMERYFGWLLPEGQEVDGPHIMAEAERERCVLDVFRRGRSNEAELAGSFGGAPKEDDKAYKLLMEKNGLDMEVFVYAQELFAAQAMLPAPIVVDDEAATTAGGGAQQPSPAQQPQPPQGPSFAEDVPPFDEATMKINCIANGRFTADPPMSNWYAVKSEVQVVPSYDGKGKDIKVVNREHHLYGGLWQNLIPNCMIVGEWYEIRAVVRPTLAGTDDTPFVCDPTVMFGNLPVSCPGLGLRVNEDMRELAYTVGPLKPDGDGLVELYGVVRATPELASSRLSLFVSRAPPEVDITVDSVTMKLAPPDATGMRDCSSGNLIANGDAEVGDHRFWFIRGQGGSGMIEVVSPGYDGQKYAFRHGGQRTERYTDMLQSLDPSCFVEGSQWKITAQFRYFSLDEKSGDVQYSTCRKDNPKAPDSCPVFGLDFVRGGQTVSTGPMVNDAPGDVKAGGEWNEVRHTFEVTADMALRPEVWFYVNSVDPAYNYDIDDIRMVPA